MSCSIGLGMKKRVCYQKIHLLLLITFILQLSKAGWLSTSCLSMILALQRNNEMYKNIRRPYCRLKTASARNIIFSYRCLICFFFLVLTTWVFALILLAGDVQENPGPDSVDSSNDSSLMTTLSSVSPSDHLSVFHLNIQSILPKIDLVRCEASAYDVLIFSESWLKADVKDESISIVNFLPPFRTDRADRPGGGVVVYVRDTLKCKRRSDLEIRGLEAVWVELQVKSRKILIGGFYRPPNSNQDYFNLMKESIDRAYNCNILDTIITGDFNIDMSSHSNNKLSELMLEYNLHQLIEDHTHYTENSSSLIDLILVRNNNSILMSGVADPFVPNLTRFHCPVIVFLKFIRPAVKSFKRRVWNYNLADFDRYRNLLLECNIDDHLDSNNDIDSNIQFIADSLFSSAEKSIPNKIVTIRPNELPWITCHIKSMIRKRKRVYRQFKRTSNFYYLDKYKKIRNKVVNEIKKKG